LHVEKSQKPRTKSISHVAILWLTSPPASGRNILNDCCNSFKDPSKIVLHDVQYCEFKAAAQVGSCSWNEQVKALYLFKQHYRFRATIQSIHCASIDINQFESMFQARLEQQRTSTDASWQPLVEVLNRRTRSQVKAIDFSIIEITSTNSDSEDSRVMSGTIDARFCLRASSHLEGDAQFRIVLFLQDGTTQHILLTSP
jgi:hypothetical protein